MSIHVTNKNQYMKNNLPKNTTKLIIGPRFNEVIENVPMGILEINFNSEWNAVYNKPIHNLPISVTKISMNPYFNQPMNDLPMNLKYLHLGLYYNFELDNLPVSLESLTVGVLFNKNISLFTCNLKKLDLSNNYLIKIVDHLPNSLRELLLPREITCTLDNLPCNLEILHIQNYNLELNHLPPKLKELHFAKRSNFRKKLDNLPPKLKVLNIGTFFNQPIDNLPESIEYLSFCKSSIFNNPVNKFPNNLLHLSFGNTFNYQIDKNLPDCLEILELGTNFNIFIERLPTNIKILKFGKESKFNQPIKHFFNHLNLKEIHLGKNFKQKNNYSNSSQIKIIKLK
jgi:hypothetical protein